MERRQFISFLTATGLTFPLTSAARLLGAGHASSPKVPAFLREGDTIGITSPASYISLEDIQPSVRLMESWGFKVEVGETIGTRDFALGGTDLARASDLQAMLDNDRIKAIMCARGGYGLVRIIDQLNFKIFRARPKWIIGFSDVTILHTHINSNYGIATLHSKMCNSFPSDWSRASPMQIETILSIRQTLSGDQTRYTSPAHINNRLGRAEGVLVGGNLSIIASVAGSSSALKTEGKILFLEDTHEDLYRIDRMLWTLKRIGTLDAIKGLVIGGFNLNEESPGEEFGKTLYDIVTEKIKEFSYPVCFDFPVGHQVNNYAIKCGSKYIFDVQACGGSLTSI